MQIYCKRVMCYLSIMQRENGNYLGSLMLNVVEPATDKEQIDMGNNPSARDAFLARWFKRTKDVMAESGGLFVISVCDSLDSSTQFAWPGIPDYVITIDQSTGNVLKRA